MTLLNDPTGRRLYKIYFAEINIGPRKRNLLPNITLSECCGSQIHSHRCLRPSPHFYTKHCTLHVCTQIWETESLILCWSIWIWNSEILKTEFPTLLRKTEIIWISPNFFFRSSWRESFHSCPARWFINYSCCCHKMARHEVEFPAGTWADLRASTIPGASGGNFVLLLKRSLCIRKLAWHLNATPDPELDCEPGGKWS